MATDTFKPLTHINDRLPCCYSLVSSLSKQVKGLKLISGVMFIVGYWIFGFGYLDIWYLLASTVNMRSKKLSLSAKQAIISLKNQKSPNQNQPNQLFGTFLKMKNVLSLKDLEDHGKQLWWTTDEFFPWWRKTPSQLLAKTKNPLQEVGEHESQSTIKRRLHQSIQRAHHKM